MFKHPKPTIKTLIIIGILFLCFSFSKTNFVNYPEDISSLDYLIYSDKEFHLASFHFITTPSNLLKYDYRNGITIYPFTDVK